ncbi:MAG: hypothetical protein ACLR13_09795 [Acutalibacteraceae bacterium]
MKELLEQGIIGDLKLIRTSQNSFARRYDWQTLLYREGGAMRNNLAHSIEQIMDPPATMNYRKSIQNSLSGILSATRRIMSTSP